MGQDENIKQVERLRKSGLDNGDITSLELLSLGPNLRRVREQKGLSVTLLAKKAEVSPSHLRRLETGKSYPKLDMLIRLSVALDVSVYELFVVEE